MIKFIFSVWLISALLEISISLLSYYTFKLPFEFQSISIFTRLFLGGLTTSLVLYAFEFINKFYTYFTAQDPFLYLSLVFQSINYVVPLLIIWFVYAKLQIIKKSNILLIFIVGALAGLITAFILTQSQQLILGQLSGFGSIRQWYLQYILDKLTAGSLTAKYYIFYALEYGFGLAIARSYYRKFINQEINLTFYNNYTTANRLFKITFVIFVGSVIVFGLFSISSKYINRLVAIYQDRKLQLNVIGNVGPIKIYVAKAKLSTSNTGEYTITEERLETPSYASYTTKVSPSEAVKKRLDDRLRNIFYPFQDYIYFLQNKKIYRYDKNSKALISASVTEKAVSELPGQRLKIISIHDNNIVLGYSHGNMNEYNPVFVYDSKSLSLEQVLLKETCKDKECYEKGYWFTGTFEGKDYFQTINKDRTLVKVYDPTNHTIIDIIHPDELKTATYGYLNKSKGIIIFPYNCGYEGPCKSEYWYDLKTGRLTDHPIINNKDDVGNKISSKIKDNFEFLKISVKTIPVHITSEKGEAIVKDADNKTIKLYPHPFNDLRKNIPKPKTYQDFYFWDIQKVKQLNNDQLIIALINSGKHNEYDDGARILIYNIKTGAVRLVDRNLSTHLAAVNIPLIVTKSPIYSSSGNSVSGLIYRLLDLDTQKVLGQFVADNKIYSLSPDNYPVYGPEFRNLVKKEIHRYHFWSDRATDIDIMANFRILIDDNSIVCSKTVCNFKAKAILGSSIRNNQSHFWPNLNLEIVWKPGANLIIKSSKIESSD